MYRADTIVACATPPGRGAIAIVRLSGKDALRIADELTRPLGGKPPVAWKLARAIVLDAAGGVPIDDALVVRMPAPRTYTGEDVVEIHCHGSALLVESVIAAVVSRGARAAEPGEFSRRAVLNGRMDLLQAEAVADLIDARVGAGARAAWEQLQGALSQAVRALRGTLVSVLADIEANVDFSDEELPAERLDARREPLAEVVAGIDSLLGGFAAARRRRDGHVVVFAGRPNVGKSSLVNALLGYGRMIVSDEAGTTRDTVEELVDLGGEAFVLTDTAGDRVAPGAAERAAVERARETRRRADIEVVVIDRSQPLEADDRRLLEPGEDVSRIVVANKADLTAGLHAGERELLAFGATPVLEVSALSGYGCEALAAALLAAARDLQPGEPVAISRVRHRSALEEARAPLLRAADLLVDETAPELVAIELRAVIERLATITEPLDNEEVLDEIFAEFCIGK